MTAIAAHDLSVGYGETPAIWDLSFELPAGVMCAIVGPNGAGKSTLLKAALGVVRPLAGSITYEGQSYRKVRRRIAYVPQRESVDWDFPITAEEVVLMGRYGRMGRWARRADREATRQALRTVGMEEYAERQIGQLSGGQQQRLFVARALIQGADTYLLDEPFAGVDASTEQVLLDVLRAERDAGKTILVVHHDLTTVEQIFDWALLLNVRLVACGPLSEVFNLANVERTYGHGSALFGELFKLSQGKTSGLQ